MKFIPLTHHYQTMASIYEKCADISKQIDVLSQSPRPNVQIENDDTQQQEIIQKDKKLLDRQIQKQIENLSLDKQDSKKDQRKKLQKRIKQKKFGKRIAKKQLKSKVQVNCDHCDKVFETEKLYQRHQYQLMYRKKLEKRKLIKQTKDVIQIEEKEIKQTKRGRKPKNTQKKIDSIEICI
ncbi:unnamed protein product [Paramecium sonneborni]|uniref:C2H2-type domain-containing protein n=1 Tax=Paramecium sonneborni TaxID=65129 RepID=A0A8S1RQQ1_9CILI|nr:unnamed protein product [Paramecium sonneborni]